MKSINENMPARKKHVREVSLLINELRNAIVDPNGLGRLHLMLQNAHVPVQYHDIFIKIFACANNHNLISKVGGGSSEISEDKTLSYPPICIDCGAHAGLITDIILLCGGISYAFEPNMYLHNILQSKYHNNSNVILHQQAVSNRFYKSQFFTDGSIVSQGSGITQSMYQTQSLFEVDVVDITDIIEKEILPKHKRIYFLKLDVEGAEFDIMDSLLQKQLYKHIDFIACETHERYVNDGKLKMQKLKDSIKEHGANNILLDWV